MTCNNTAADRFPVSGLDYNREECAGQVGFFWRRGIKERATNLQNPVRRKGAKLMLTRTSNFCSETGKDGFRQIPKLD